MKYVGATDRFIRIPFVIEGVLIGFIGSIASSGALIAIYNGIYEMSLEANGVLGGLNIKKYYGNKAFAIFIQPPSVDEHRNRLNSRATDSPEVIEKRIERAEFELSFAPKFDIIIINDELKKAKEETLNSIKNFLDKK